jgi:hypothetical protein
MQVKRNSTIQTKSQLLSTLLLKTSIQFSTTHTEYKTLFVMYILHYC